MKRWFTSIFVLFAFVSLYGVDRQTALKVAQTVLNGPDTKSAGGVIELLWDGSPVTKSKSVEDPSFYVYGRNEGGFVIVSGFESTHPVLGYSLTGVFNPDRIPEGARALLHDFHEAIFWARQLSLKQSESIKAEWEQLLNGEILNSEKEVLLETAKWDQVEPYNMYCPVVNGVKTVTGCTNTSTAIVMRYHKWPEAGVGTLPGYDGLYQAEGVHFEGHSLGHKYDWDSMPLERLHPDEADNNAKHEMAQLMYDLGIMNRSYYGPSTSAALRMPEFIAHFNYDPGIQRIQRDLVVGDLEWERLIKSEMDAARPILYCASIDGVSGHQFVIDGYRGRYFHVNMGWGGFEDAFMLVTPVDNESSRLTYGLPSAHWMYIGIQPNKTNNPSKLQVTHIFVGNNSLSQDAPINVSANVKSYAMTAQSVEVAFGLVSESGNIEELISSSSVVQFEEGFAEGHVSMDCTIHTTLREDHTIRLCACDAEGNWTIIPADSQSVFPLSYHHQLRNLCTLDYLKTMPDSDEWEKISIRFPRFVFAQLFDSEGTLLLDNYYYKNMPVGDDLFYRSDAYCFIIEHKRASASCKHTVRIRDLIEEVEFDVIF